MQHYLSPSLHGQHILYPWWLEAILRGARQLGVGAYWCRVTLPMFLSISPHIGCIFPLLSNGTRETLETSYVGWSYHKSHNKESVDGLMFKQGLSSLLESHSLREDTNYLPS